MKRTIETRRVLEAYNVLGTAKYGQLDEKEKVAVWKIAMAMMGIATRYDEVMNAARKTFKPCDDFEEKVDKIQQYETMIRQKDCELSKLPMGAAEYADLIANMVKPYNRLVGKAMEEESEKKVTLEFEPVSEDTFSRLMASNEWTMGQAAALGHIIMK